MNWLADREEDQLLPSQCQPRPCRCFTPSSSREEVVQFEGAVATLFL